MFQADSLTWSAHLFLSETKEAFALKESYFLERFVLDTNMAAISSGDEVTSHGS